MDKSTGRTRVIVLIVSLAVVAMAARTYDLGALSFFGDEETTALAARSLAEGGGSRMPSGMPYHRALPFTWLNSVSARLLGLDSEFPYRLPAALIGALTVPLLYFVTAGLAGSGAGFIAALLLALSGWHLVWSRTARMYAPLLFVAIAFFAASFRWQRSGRRRTLATAFLLYLLAVFLHSAGGALALFPILFALLYDSDQVRAGVGLVVALLMALCGLILDRVFVVAPYDRWVSDFSMVSSLPAGQLAESLTALIEGLPAFALYLAFVGLIVGIAWSRTVPVDRGPGGPGRLTRSAIISLAGLAVGSGFAGIPVAAGMLGMAALLIDGRGWKPWWSQRFVGIAATGTVIGTTGRLITSQSGFREILMTPFPYLPYLGRLLPALMLVFCLVLAWLIVRGMTTTFDTRPIRVSGLFVLGYCLALGLVEDWAPWRYLLLVYPWILIVAGTGIGTAASILADRVRWFSETRVAILIAVLILAGLVGGHGIPATLTVVRAVHGSSVPWNDGDLITRPDHRTPGQFVQRHLRPGDVVLAEDALEQTWYTGRVDLWFRSADDARRFLYVDAGGVARDIYVSAVLQERPPPDDMLSREGTAVWLITSGETANARAWYLSQAQIDWLEMIEATHEPEFMGADGVSGVFCFGRCP